MGDYFTCDTDRTALYHVSHHEYFSAYYSVVDLDSYNKSMNMQFVRRKFTAFIITNNYYIISVIIIFNQKLDPQNNFMKNDRKVTNRLHTLEMMDFMKSSRQARPPNAGIR